MRLIAGTQVVIKLNDEEHHFTLVDAGGDGNERLNVKAPLAVLLGAMTIKMPIEWIPLVKEAEPMRVELMKVVEVTQ